MVVSVALLLFSLVAASPNTDTVELQALDLDSPVVDVLFCGPENDITLTLTQKHSVYRSENKGFSWRLLQNILEREGMVHAEDAKGMGQVTKLMQSPVDKRLIVMLGSKGINWFSDDCGKSVWALNYGRPIYDFQFHPVRRDWGLAASWTTCTDLENEPCELYKQLYYTTNLKDWEFITDYVVQFAWAQTGLDADIQGRIPKERIYVTYIPNASGHQYLKGWSSKVDFVRSDDFFKSRTVLVPRGNKFIVSSRYVLVAQVMEDDTSEVQLLVSNERNFEVFYKAELPMKRLTDHSYTLLDTSEGSMFLHINHMGQKAKYGNIYISDGTGRRFSLSLLRAAQGADSTCEFDKIYGLEGIYIANVYDKDVVSSLDQKSSTNSGKKTKKETQESIEKRTVITFDKGGVWRQLAAPERDSLGKKTRCDDDDCSLHLHSLSSTQFPPVYSSDNAVGIVLGVGNVGSYLSLREDELNTYLSRDGGLTWTEVRKGSHIYEIGDHGALIVMAENMKATDTVFYTWNEGMTWESLKFADKPIEVENIIISPGGISQNFLILGARGAKGVTVALDFTSLHEPQCRGIESAGEPGSDYEQWSPNDGRAGSKCLMGRAVMYPRRKPESECYNGEELERATSRTHCICTEEDYECDLGYYREENSPCRPLPNFDQPTDTCLPGDEYYEILTGYRKVAGNTCISGVADRYEPAKVACSRSYVQWTYILLMLLAAGGGYYAWTKPEAVYKVWDRAVDYYNQPKYTRDLGQVPESAEEDIIIRTIPRSLPTQDAPLDDFDPRK